MNILLIGARACGKTTIGKLLAQRLHLAFVDLDERTSARFSGSSITQIWANHGEKAWRAAEILELREALRHDAYIIALGGGTPMSQDAQILVNQAQSTGAARVVYLRCDASELAHRLRDAPGDRPSLTGGAVHDEIEKVLTEREQTYRALADVQIDCARRSPQEIVDAIVELMNVAEGGV